MLEVGQYYLIHDDTMFFFGYLEEKPDYMMGVGVNYDTNGFMKLISDQKTYNINYYAEQYSR